MRDPILDELSSFLTVGDSAGRPLRRDVDRNPLRAPPDDRSPERVTALLLPADAPCCLCAITEEIRSLVREVRGAAGLEPIRSPIRVGCEFATPRDELLPDNDPLLGDVAMRLLTRLVLGGVDLTLPDELCDPPIRLPIPLL